MKRSKIHLALTVFAACMASTAVAHDVPQHDSSWYKDSQATLKQRLAQKPNVKKAKNVILLIADGNGVASNYITRLYVGQKQGGYGDEHLLAQDKFPHVALSKTYNSNAQTPDSAGTGTAMNTGVKTKAGVLGVSDKARRGKCEDVAANSIPGFSDLAAAEGKQVGVVSTARITHATPAAVYAHSGDRNWAASVPEGCDQKTIAEQLIDEMQGGLIDIALGGGMRNFIPKAEGSKGKRKDGRDLIKEAQEKGITFVSDTAGLKAANLDGKTPLLGLFSNSHMSYEADRGDKEPSIAEMTETAINYLSKSENGYYLMVESGRVDHANHAGNAYRTVTDGEAFADAVAKAVEMTGDDTLIIVTADHSHALALNGYTGRGANILGLSYKINPDDTKHLDELNLADDGKPYTTIGFLNGPGSILKKSDDYKGARTAVTQAEAIDPDYIQEALVPKSSETHSGVDVAIYAQGPWAHLFNGTVEQNYVYHVMQHAILNGE